MNRWRRADDVCVVVTCGVTRRVLSHRWAKETGRCEGRGDKADEQKDSFKLRRQLSLA